VINGFNVSGEDGKTQTQTQTAWQLHERTFIDFELLA
jgi:hypothetical protein